jgi:GMP synthase (glutamine-hydrolysing)
MSTRSAQQCAPPGDANAAVHQAQAPFPADAASTVLIIQHSCKVPPAYVATFLTAHAIPFHVLHIDLGHQLPSEDVQWKAVVSLGGPQASYEEADYPWIVQEKRFLLAHLKKSTPILCICLGAQMLAHAIGGKAYKASHMEAGYTLVKLTEAGQKDPLVSKLFADLKEDDVASASNFLMHHGDTFDLPPDVPLLAASDFKQIFRYGSALAVQFHPEASVNEIELWTSWHPERYPPIGTTAEELVELVKQRKEKAMATSKVFFEHWWTSYGFKL